jgi:hypothetical protein
LLLLLLLFVMERAENGVRGIFPFFHERSFPLGFFDGQQTRSGQLSRFPFLFWLGNNNNNNNSFSLAHCLSSTEFSNLRISRFNEDAHDNLNEFQIEIFNVLF